MGVALSLVEMVLAYGAALWPLMHTAELYYGDDALHWTCRHHVWCAMVRETVAVAMVVTAVLLVAYFRASLIATVAMVVNCGLCETCCCTEHHHTDDHHVCKSSLHNLVVFYEPLRLVIHLFFSESKITTFS